MYFLQSKVEYNLFYFKLSVHHSTGNNSTVSAVIVPLSI